MRLRPVAILAVASGILLSTLSLAQSAPPSGDTFSFNGHPSQNYGSQIALVVQSEATSYIQFNLSTLPTGASVSKATLRLFVDAVTQNGSFIVCPVISPWSEGTLTYNNAPNVSHHCGAAVTVNGSSLNQFLVIDISSQVQGWVSNPTSNNGLALVLNGSNGSFSFDSKESFLTAHQPELEIALTGSGGATGPTGPTGATGATGPTGNTGAVGPQGPTGNTGAQGPQGLQGPMGLMGAQGPTGATGANGTNGTGFNFKGPFVLGTSYDFNDVVTDTNGSSYVAIHSNHGASDPASDTADWTLMAAAGATGPTGAQGLQGNTGATGAVGSQGAIGPQGNTGATGAVGPTGPQGAKGDTGATGATGVQGPQGIQGLTGATGPQGSMGLTGAQGPTGATGATGANGTNGTGFNFTQTWSSATNYNPYDVVTYNGATYDATVAISSGGNPPDTNPSWVLMAAAGATGPTGAAGPQGNTGATGPQGTQGLAGATGATGPQGIQGLTGATGAVGAQGPVGPTGAKGDTGATGPIGAQGPTGNTGATGAVGAQGPVGPTGAMGPQGNTGATGATGPQGATGPSAGYFVSGVAQANCSNPSCVSSTLSLPAGSYIITASVAVSNNNVSTAAVFCNLVGGGNGTASFVYVASGGEQNVTLIDYFSGTLSANVVTACSSTFTSVFMQNAVVSAVLVGVVHHSP